jgi:transcriptional regulator with XRE-family HTH domain
MDTPGSGADVRARRVAAGLNLRALAAKMHISAGHLSQVENGLRNVSHGLWAKVIWHTDGSADADTLVNVNRRDFATTIASAALGALAPEQVTRILRGIRRPAATQVTMTEVDIVQQAAQLLMKVDLEHGGAAAQDLATSTLRWAGGLLDADMTAPVRARLSAAVGLLGDRAGWALYDSGQSGPAGRLLAWSLNHAAAGNDPDLRAHIILDLSTVVTDAGDPRRGVDLLRMALGDEQVSPSERANLHAVCARHCGTAGDRQAGLRHVGLAAETATTPAPAQYPEWAQRITLSPGHRASAAGLALFELGEHERAVGELDAALAALSGSRARTTLRCQIRRVVLYLRDGEPDMAQVLAGTVFSTVPGIRSRRISADLEMLAREASGQPAIAGAAAEAARRCGV